MSQRTPRREPKNLPRHAVAVVGIGASAGGLEAFSSLLKALPSDTGMAFVLISHLMHERKSMLGELLSKATPMPVVQVGQETTVRPNHIYVIPPNKQLVIGNGDLKLTPLTETERPPMVIDRFLRSLAQARKSKAVGVILSGTGTDGTLGLAEIKGQGGITFVQDQATAEYGDMPRSAQPSADYVLSPENIAKELKRIADHPYVSKPPVIQSAAQNTDDLRQIFAMIQACGGVDFGHYKPASVRRRIARRMVLKKIESFAEYLEHLRADKSEVTALFQDLLITVTEFFRDPEVFDVLKKEIIPQILTRLPKDTSARVWVPGCASGEEAYSIAICFIEVAAKRGTPPVQIFATDVSGPCIARARRGFYPENIIANVSRDRLRRFFVKETGGYRIAKFVRDLCIFAQQDVIRDAPFSRMDLVSCRNLLIYLDTPTQKDVLHRFHFALQPAGFLLLGTAESPAAAPQLFENAHKAHKIYTKLGAATRIGFARLQRPIAHEPPLKPGSVDRPLVTLQKKIDHLLLKRFAPSGVLLNAAMEIVEFRGSTNFLIEPRPGEASLNIFRMVRKELAMPLRVALHEARTSPGPVRRESITVRVNHDQKRLNIEVTRFGPPESNGPMYFLVLFEEKSSHFPGKRQLQHKILDAAATSPEPRIADLEEQLKTAQVDLTSIIEQHETTNEELQSANEEVLAANEELRSMNEEMQTAREELQASNEELHSVNDELQKRNSDLADAYSHVMGLVVSLDIACVLVDGDLRIRSFTPLAQKVLSLIATDVGRSIADIRPKIDIPRWPTIISEVMQTMSSTEQEIQDSQGHWYAMRIRPYKTQAMKLEGAVVFLIDVDTLKRTKAALDESEARWHKLLQELPDFILNPNGEILFINRTPASLAKPAAIGASIYEVIEPTARALLKQALENVSKSGEPTAFNLTGSGALDNTLLETVITPIKSGGKLAAMTMHTKQLESSNGKPATRPTTR